jgi:hypothetical protein
MADPLEMMWEKRWEILWVLALEILWEILSEPLLVHGSGNLLEPVLDYPSASW